MTARQQRKRIDAATSLLDSATEDLETAVESLKDAGYTEEAERLDRVRQSVVQVWVEVGRRYRREQQS